MNIFRRCRLWGKEAIKIIKSYIFCFKYLPYWQAKKMPIFLDVPIKVYDLGRGRIILNDNIQSRQIWFGRGVAGLSEKPTCIEIQKGGRLEFNGTAHISRGCVLRVDSGAVLKMGDKVGINCNCFIRCGQSIILGDRLLMGWNNEISDDDGHDVWLNNAQQTRCKPVSIGNHVWITSHVRIGKGVEIADDCIIAKGAVVVNSHTAPNSLIGGVPARIIHGDIKWKR